MSDDGKVVLLTDDVRARYSKSKCRHDASYDVDTGTGDVFCRACGACISPSHALIEIARRHEIRELRHAQMLDEAKALAAWVPALRVVRELQIIWKGNGLPQCGHCKQPLKQSDILDRWGNPLLRAPP